MRDMKGATLQKKITLPANVGYVFSRNLHNPHGSAFYCLYLHSPFNNGRIHQIQ